MPMITFNPSPEGLVKSKKGLSFVSFTIRSLTSLRLTPKWSKSIENKFEGYISLLSALSLNSPQNVV